MTRTNVGTYKINFGPGFTVNDRFLSVTTTISTVLATASTNAVGAAANELFVVTRDLYPHGDGDVADSQFFLIIY